MNAPYTAPRAPVADQAVEASKSAVSWAAIFAGTAVAISISLVLLTLGSGLGLASLTPSTRSAASPGSLAALVTVWIIVVQWLSAASGGYVTGRLRTRWVGTHIRPTGSSLGRSPRRLSRWLSVLPPPRCLRAARTRRQPWLRALHKALLAMLKSGASLRTTSTHCFATLRATPILPQTILPQQTDGARRLGSWPMD